MVENSHNWDVCCATSRQDRCTTRMGNDKQYLVLVSFASLAPARQQVMSATITAHLEYLTYLSPANIPSWPPRSNRGSIDGKTVSRELTAVNFPLTTAAEGFCNHQHKKSSSPRHTSLSDDNSCRVAKNSVQFGSVRALIFQHLRTRLAPIHPVCLRPRPLP